LYSVTTWHVADHVMAQTIGHRPLVAEVRVRSHAILYGVCDGQSGTVIGFTPYTNVLPSQY
jgi:hypothetical protein